MSATELDEYSVSDADFNEDDDEELAGFNGSGSELGIHKGSYNAVGSEEGAYIYTGKHRGGSNLGTSINEPDSKGEPLLSHSQKEMKVPFSPP